MRRARVQTILTSSMPRPNGMTPNPYARTSAVRDATGMVHVRGVRENNLRNIDVDIPRDALVVFTGVRARRYDAGRFSFNVAKGRCETCEGEGFVMVELLFLPSVYAPCPTCHGARYNAKTLEITYRDRNIADVLRMTVDSAWGFFADEPQVQRPARRAPAGRTRLSATRAASHRTLRRGSAADQARHRAATNWTRQYALHPRRANHRPPSI